MRSRSSRIAVALLSVLAASAGALRHPAAAEQHCVRPEIVLWGDGRHDDTAALNAWLRGDDAIWGDDGTPVGDAVAGRAFRLSAAVYVSAGTDRRLENFRMVWPERGETVTGGTIATGRDPDTEPAVSGIRIVGGDSGEGKPFDAPAPANVRIDPSTGCATS